jgi:urea transporter
MFMFPVLFVVRWNKINGKAAALGCVIASVNSAAIALKMDGYQFVPRGWYVFSAVFFLAALHLAFNANPMLTSAMLLEKEKAQAAKKS